MGVSERVCCVATSRQAAHSLYSALYWGSGGSRLMLVERRCKGRRARCEQVIPGVRDVHEIVGVSGGASRRTLRGKSMPALGASTRPSL